MRYWKKQTGEQIKERVFSALRKNVNFRERTALGVPSSKLDEKVFYDNAPILKDAPFLSTLLQNPNHIGCHTLGESESFFAGTQELERELIGLCAEDILQGEAGKQDGYVAAGGTEANIQAIWIYRNYFMRAHEAGVGQIAILCSQDAHYSMFKAANLLNIKVLSVEVDFETRILSKEDLNKKIALAKQEGIRFFIVVGNMMTTMFGSVDNIETYVEVLEKAGMVFKIHIDGAFGGFVYPFSHRQNQLNFRNPNITSFALDAHKMVEAPYGTGIFLIRKGWMKYACTEEAQYVQGLDATLSGSRSGSNAISVWMILMTYGPNGWFEKVHILNYRASWLCLRLDELEVAYYRYPGSNIVTLQSKNVPAAVAHRFGLVPDVHSGKPDWYKIVVMDHVTVDELAKFVEALKKAPA